MQIFKSLFCITMCLLCLHFATGMGQNYCDNTLDCNGPNTLCIKNRCMCIKSNKWDEDNYECDTGSTSESPKQKRPEPDVVKVQVEDDNKISFYKSANFFASYTFIIFCVIICIFTCFLKILAMRRWQMRLRDIRHMNSYA